MSHCEAPGLMPLDEALKQQLNQIHPVQDVECVQLKQATNRIIAEDVEAQLHVPPCDNSAMDGYALIANDWQQPINIVGEALAGHPYEGQLQSGQAVRIMTGAAIPAGADAVVMQEQTQVNDNILHCTAQVHSGQSIRRAGEDICKGDVIVAKGQRLRAAQLALLASVGINTVTVYRKLKVAVMATGDELKEPGTELQAGEIYESNRTGLIAMLEKLPVEVVDLGIVEDSLDATKRALSKASKQCDWVLSSGGVSVGDADFVKQALDELGEINFWKVAIKPGKPYAYGQLGQSYFSGLPGNPVSSFVTFLQLVLPCLQTLSGETLLPALTLNATLKGQVKRRAGRTEFQRAFMYNNDQGQLIVEAKGKQGSGIMNSFTNANCFLVIPANTANIAEGELVCVQPFNELLI